MYNLLVFLLFLLFQKLCGGTTAVCTLILNKRLYVAWVGDSTAMLVKRDNVVQLVNPHRLHREVSLNIFINYV